MILAARHTLLYLFKRSVSLCHAIINMWKHHKKMMLMQQGNVKCRNYSPMSLFMHKMCFKMYEKCVSIAPAP